MSAFVVVEVGALPRKDMCRDCLFCGARIGLGDEDLCAAFPKLGKREKDEDDHYRRLPQCRFQEIIGDPLCHEALVATMARLHSENQELFRSKAAAIRISEERRGEIARLKKQLGSKGE